MRKMPKSTPRRLEFYLGLWTLLFLAGIGALVLLGSFAPKSPALILNTKDIGDRLRVEWDAGSRVVSSAQGGTLEALDAGRVDRYPVEPHVLQSGSFDYIRRSQDVLLTLTLYHDGQPGARGVIRSVSGIRLPEASEAPPARTVQRARRGSRR